MTFRMEMVSAPDLSKLNWVFDDGRGRVLVRTGTRIDSPPSITVRVVADSSSRPQFDNSYIELDDGRTQPTTAYYDYGSTDDKINRWFFDTVYPADGTLTREFTYQFDRDEILGQYDDGEWSQSGISPGEITVTFGYEGYAETASSTVELTPPPDTAVRSNVRVTDLSIDVINGIEPRLSPTATVANPTNHGVDYPATVITRADGQVVNSEQVLIERLSGSASAPFPNESTATLPSVTLPRGTQRATVSVEPRDWAAAYGRSYSESVNTSAPVPSDVQIVDCNISQSRIRAPAEVEMSATVENPTPFRVETELTFALGGRSETETVVLSPNERYTASQPVAALSGGTKQGTVDITRTREV